MGILDKPAAPAQTITDEGLSAARLAALRPWHAALARRDYQKAVALFCGTSMTEGGPMLTTSRDRRWTDRLHRLLRARYPLASQPAGSIGYIPSFYQTFSAGGTSQYGLVTPVGVTYSGDHLEVASGIGARTIELDSTGDWIEFAFTGTGADLHLASRAIASSTGTVTIDGGAPIAASIPAGTNAAALQQIRGLTAGAHTVRVTWSSGQVDVGGLYPYSGDENKGIHVYDGGKGSATASNFANAGPFRQNANLQPSLVCIEFGYNEFFGNTSVATFKTNLQAVVTNALGNGLTLAPTCLFIIWQEPYDATPATEPYSAYATAIKEVAAATTNGIVVDFRNRFPAYNSNALGLWGTDTVHHSDAGAAYVADVLNEVLAPR
jgi:lysophospholipase L1-like esterase